MKTFGQSLPVIITNSYPFFGLILLSQYPRAVPKFVHIYTTQRVMHFYLSPHNCVSGLFIERLLSILGIELNTLYTWSHLRLVLSSTHMRNGAISIIHWRNWDSGRLNKLLKNTLASDKTGIHIEVCINPKPVFFLLVYFTPQIF